MPWIRRLLCMSSVAWIQQSPRCRWCLQRRARSHARRALCAVLQTISLWRPQHASGLAPACPLCHRQLPYPTAAKRQRRPQLQQQKQQQQLTSTPRHALTLLRAASRSLHPQSPALQTPWRQAQQHSGPGVTTPSWVHTSPSARPPLTSPQCSRAACMACPCRHPVQRRRMVHHLHHARPSASPPAAPQCHAAPGLLLPALHRARRPQQLHASCSKQLRLRSRCTLTSSTVAHGFQATALQAAHQAQHQAAH